MVALGARRSETLPDLTGADVEGMWLDSNSRTANGAGEVRVTKVTRSTKGDGLDHSRQDQSRAETVKRPYTRPVVLTHGNLREITLANGSGIRNDNAGRHSHRTNGGGDD